MNMLSQQFPLIYRAAFITKLDKLELRIMQLKRTMAWFTMYVLMIISVGVELNYCKLKTNHFGHNGCLNCVTVSPDMDHFVPQEERSVELVRASVCVKQGKL